MLLDHRRGLGVPGEQAGVSVEAAGVVRGDVYQMVGPGQ